MSIKQKVKKYYLKVQGILQCTSWYFPFVTYSNTVASFMLLLNVKFRHFCLCFGNFQRLIPQELEKDLFPTELKDKILLELLGKRGKEFGTVTSRKRRCGWFHGVLVRQTIKISGINGIALTKLDVLDELDEIKMCIAYDLNGKKIDYLPAAVDDQLKVIPLYRIFKGWKSWYKRYLRSI